MLGGRNMPGKGKWASTPNAARNRKVVSLTLSEDELELLDELAKACGESRGAVVAAALALLDAERKR
jgi:hypothetical protein